jgi:signal transduction histidine kinase
MLKRVAQTSRNPNDGGRGRRRYPWRGPKAGWLRRNLRAQVAVGVGVPILLALTLLALAHYWRERHLLEDQARLAAAQLGRMVNSALRYSMLTNDAAMLASILSDIAADGATVERARVVDLDGRVYADSGPGGSGQSGRAADPGCAFCHQAAPDQRRPTAVMGAGTGLLSVAVPIDNEPACRRCHETGAMHLGILILEVPLSSLWPSAVRDLRINLAMSGLLTLVMIAGLYLLLHRLIVRRVESFRPPLAAFAAGHLEARLPAGQPPDEVDELALSFNRMAERLARNAREERARSDLRQRAIVEERERIARELHDGLAQVLGYVHNKATAVRLLLGRGQQQAAEAQLAQLEEAARGLFVEVREAILGLRLAGQGDLPMPSLLSEYAARFSGLSDLPVTVAVAPELRGLVLPAETELHLLRITQEALSNVRKHAQASQVNIGLAANGPIVELSISDNGRGFKLDQPGRSHRQRYGLTTMRERAEAIGADFSVRTQPAGGTRVLVRLPVGEGWGYARPGS